MSSYNEIVAIKSLGISPMTVIWPTLVLATFVSFAGVWLNDLAVSWGTLGVERVLLESLEDVVYSQLRDAADVQQRQIQHHGPRRRRPQADAADR